MVAPGEIRSRVLAIGSLAFVLAGCGSDTLPPGSTHDGGLDRTSGFDGSAPFDGGVGPADGSIRMSNDAGDTQLLDGRVVFPDGAVRGGCVRDSECAGHVDGEICVLFAERCGQCMLDEHCPSGQRCTETFTCEELTDEECAVRTFGSRPYAGEHQCVQCEADVHCIIHDGPHCTEQGFCGECGADEHCGGDMPYCDQYSGDCRACTDDAHCPASAPHCDGSSCVPCLEDAHCPATHPVCTYSTGERRCVACEPTWGVLDRGCPTERPICDEDLALEGASETAACKECLSWSACPEGEYCIDGTCGPAIDCASDEQCEAHPPLARCTPEGCVECARDSDCGGGSVYLGRCDEEANRCVRCTEDWHCFGEGGICSDDNRCVDCRDDGDCGGAQPFCHLGSCSACADDECECATHDDCDGEEICNADGQCSECTPDLCMEGEFCAEPPAVLWGPICYECYRSEHCAEHPNGEQCVDNRCRECRTDVHCEGHPEGALCSDFECGSCRWNGDCDGHPDGPYCNAGRCQSCDGFDQCDLGHTEFVCGTYVNGCGGVFACGECGGGGSCHDGGRACSCLEDRFDGTTDNNTAATATALANMRDAPRSYQVHEDLSIHADGDEDWYVVQIEDTGLDGNPDIELDFETVSRDSSRYEVSIWLACADGSSNDSTCEGGSTTADETHGVGCIASGEFREELSGQINCGGTIDDSGTVMIRVRKVFHYGRCDGYRFSLDVN